MFHEKNNLDKLSFTKIKSTCNSFMKKNYNYNKFRK